MEKISRQKIPQKLGRAAVSGIASLPDIVNEALGINAMNRARGIHKKSAREAAQELYDEYLPGGKPETKTEKVIYAIPEYGSTGLIGGVAKGTGKAAQALSNFLKPTGLGAAGTAASETVLANSPDSKLTAVAASLAPALGAKSVKKVANTTGDIVRKSMLKMSPHRQDQVLKKIAKDIGEESIGAVEHKEAGKLGLKATRKEKKILDDQFKELFQKRDSILGDKKDKMKIPVQEAGYWMADHYSKLKNPALKEEFLSSPLGKHLKTIIGKDKKIPVNEHDLYEKVHNSKLSYHDTEEMLHGIYNKLSNVSEIGTKEQGRLKKLSTILKNNMNSTIKENVTPQDYKFIKRLNSRYKSFSTNQKETFNHILDENAADLENVYKKVKETKPYLPTNKFISKNLSDKERSDFGKSYLRDLGFEEGNLNPRKLNKNLSNLQSSERDYIKSLLMPEESANLNKKLSLVSEVDRIAQKPSLMDLIPAKTKIADLFSSATSPENTIQMLERGLVKKKRPSMELNIGRETLKPLMQSELPKWTDEDEAELQMLESSIGSDQGTTWTPEDEAELKALESSL